MTPRLTVIRVRPQLTGVLLLTLVTISVAVTASASRILPDRVEFGTEPGASAQDPPRILSHHLAHRTPTVDGAVQPELIPDHVAYRLFSTSLTAANNAKWRNNRLSLARRAFLSRPCSVGDDARAESWASALITAADSYGARLSELDSRRNVRTGRDERERLAQDIISSLQVTLVFYRQYRSSRERHLLL
jgi:hypothetical protein